MNIYICEDNKKQRLTLETIIVSLTYNEDFKIKLSTDDPNKIINDLKSMEQKIELHNIYFLDVDLNSNMNGLTLAKEIRKYDVNGYIIFLTSHPELSMLTFQYKVKAMDYIIKSSKDEIKSRVKECFDTISKEVNQDSSNENNTISINFGDSISFFNTDEIIFFETGSKDHKIRIHTTSGFKEFYGTLKKVEEKLNDNFYKTHRSYIVNLKKIKKIDKENLIIYMNNGETCYIASRYLKGLLEKCSQ